MAYWIINTLPRHSILQKRGNSNDEFEADVLIENFDADFPLRANDYILTLDKNGEYKFEFQGEVLKNANTVSIPLTLREIEFYKRHGITNQDMPPKYRHSLHIGLHRLDEKLDDYVYSLIAIENYVKPYNHFKKKITRISPDDYETIVRKMQYVARTTFGRLFNCLPRDNQFEILQSLIVEFNTSNLRGIGFFKAIDFLRTYIEENIIDTGRYILKTREIITNSMNLGIQYDELFFSEERQTNSEEEFIIRDSMREQASAFNALLSLNSGLDLIDNLQDEINKNQGMEDRFNKLFNKRSWPVNLRI